MKTNLVKSVISTCDLKRVIEKIELITNQRAILLMNDETRKVLENKCIVLNEYKSFDEADDLGMLKVYNHRKVFIDNDLAFGEIDVR